MSANLLSASQVAKLKEVSPSAVYQAIKAGRLKSLMIAEKIVVKRSDAEAWEPVPMDQRKGIRFGGRKPKLQQPKRPRGRPRKSDTTLDDRTKE